MPFKTSIIALWAVLLCSHPLVAQQNNAQSKELTISRPLAAGSKIIIDQLDNNLTIKASADNTVKLETKVFFLGQGTVTDEEWWDYLNVEIKQLTGFLTIQPIRLRKNTEGMKRKDPSASPYDYAIRNINEVGIARFDSAGKWSNRKTNIRREFTIYLPANSQLQLENGFGDVKIETSLGSLSAVIDHSSLVVRDIAKLTLRSSYGHITTGNIGEATVNITGGNWSAKTVEKLNITSRSSSIDIASAQDLTIDSGDDQYDIDEIKAIHGTKNFGDLRILQLTGSTDITGNSAHIKIRNITETVSLIKIDNQFADLKLPLNGIKNYAIAFQGNTSKVYAPFALPENKTEFSKTTGNTTSTHTRFQLKCPNCTVEFQ